MFAMRIRPITEFWVEDDCDIFCLKLGCWTNPHRKHFRTYISDWTGANSATPPLTNLFNRRYSAVLWFLLLALVCVQPAFAQTWNYAGPYAVPSRILSVTADP